MSTTVEQRINLGLETINEYGIEDISERLSTMIGDIAPDLGSYVVEFSFGEIDNRPGLTRQQRNLATIATLVTVKDKDCLEPRIHAALNTGNTPQEIVETIINVSPFVGLIPAFEGIVVAKKVFDERGIKVKTPSLAGVGTQNAANN
jgi:4-carboxymuconolactone decarboxylase